MRPWLLVVAFLCGWLTASASAFVVMSAGALESGIMQLAARFQRETGTMVRVEIGNAPQLAARVAAGDSADVLIAPAAVVEQAIVARRVVAGSRTSIGRVGVAIVVTAGAPRPDVSSADALRRTLLAADAVVYNQGSSGTYIGKLLGDLGIAEAVSAKTVRVPNGEAVVERMAAGRGSEVAFLAMSDALRTTGLQYVGPLPPSLQNFTVYDAVVMNGASEPASAAKFIEYITTASARRTLEAAGVVAPARR
jgi:molybdate transport system substrate-binding protein